MHTPRAAKRRAVHAQSPAIDLLGERVEGVAHLTGTATEERQDARQQQWQEEPLPTPVGAGERGLREIENQQLQHDVDEPELRRPARHHCWLRCFAARREIHQRHQQPHHNRRAQHRQPDDNHLISPLFPPWADHITRSSVQSLRVYTQRAPSSSITPEHSIVI